MKNNYVFLDFETTGLVPLRSEVVEIGAVRFEDGKRVATFETLLKPTIPVEEGALAVHKLSNEHLALHGKNPEGEWKKLREFIGEDPIIAHNGLAFDFQFVFNGFANHKIAIGQNRLIDTLNLARRHLSTKTGRFSMHDLCQAYAITNKKAHSAMGDVEAMIEIFAKILEMTTDLTGMWETSGGYQLAGLGELPVGFEKMQSAIDSGLEIEIDYEGVDKPRRQRWIRPLEINVSYGNRYIVGLCLESKEKRSFRTDRVRSILGVREK